MSWARESWCAKAVSSSRVPAAAHLYEHACEAVEVALGAQDAVHQHRRGHILLGGVAREAYQVALQQLICLRARRAAGMGQCVRPVLHCFCVLQGLAAWLQEALRTTLGRAAAEQQGVTGQTEHTRGQGGLGPLIVRRGRSAALCM